MPMCKTALEVKLYAALRRIAQYQSPERLKKHSWNDWGLQDGNEALEMAYENVLGEAKSAIKGVRIATPPPSPAATTQPGSPPTVRSDSTAR